MKKIKELIVVEGKHDVDKLNRIVNADIICTHGSAIDEQTIEIIRQASENQGVIIITDPDNPGKRIRDIINQNIKNGKQVFVDKSLAIGKRNVGIEYVDDDVLLKAIEEAVSFKDDSQSLSWSEFLELNIIGNSKKRDYICQKLKIGLCNNKKMFKYINMMGYTYKQIKEIADEYDSDN